MKNMKILACNFFKLITSGEQIASTLGSSWACAERWKNN